MRSITRVVIWVIGIFAWNEFAEVCYAAMNPAKTTPAYVVGFEDGEIMAACKNNDTQRLNALFRRWELQSREISEAELALCPERVKTIYEVFEVFYCEHKSRLEQEVAAQRTAQATSQSSGRESSQPQAAEKQEYLVIQNDIRFVVLDSNEYENQKTKPFFLNPRVVELRNFRPRISSRTKLNVLYLDKTHERALNYFFNETDGDSSGCREYDKKKEMFLSEKLLLHHGHWGRYYHYITFPQVSAVALNSDLDRAYIQCRDHWYGGSSWEYHKQNGVWRMAGGIRGGWRE